MDSDLQHPPEVVPQMIAKFRDGADVVSAVRVRTQGAPWLKRLSARAFYALINRISETPVIHDAADFVLLSRDAQAALRSMPEHHRFLRGMVTWIGFRREFVEYQAPPRQAGRSTYTFPRMWRLGSDALFSFSTAPVRLAIRLGLGVVACGVLYLLYILYTLWFEPARVLPGWTSIIVVVLILSGVQILFVGVIGEYIARIFEESKRRPLYFFKQHPARRAADDPATRAPHAP
jgi:polyisoprenyl-phosphate glycosyltransferase